MKRGQALPKSEFLEAAREASLDEDKAVAFFEARRWGDHPTCPRCASDNVYAMLDSVTGKRNKDHRWRCRDCTEMHTVRTGTILEESRIKLRVWVSAYWRCCASKKGISALQLSRECEVSYKTALYILHRIRHGVTDLEPAEKLKGEVEADEAFIGGAPRWPKRSKRGRGTSKAPVFGMVERGGSVRLRSVPRVTAQNLGAELARNVDPSSHLITDEFYTYDRLGKAFAEHRTVNHSKREYVKADGTSTNTIEGVFGLLKRALYGTHHSVSRKHLPKYLAETEFKYNTRGLTDAERIEAAFKASEGKRLRYYAPGSQAAP